VGTARIRTVREVVPHTNACAPKMNMITRATTNDVFTASARWVRVSMESPTRMIQARLKRRSSQSYAAVPTRPPTAPTLVSMPNPTEPISSTLME